MFRTPSAVASEESQSDLPGDILNQRFSCHNVASARWAFARDVKPMVDPDSVVFVARQLNGITIMRIAILVPFYVPKFILSKFLCIGGRYTASVVGERHNSKGESTARLNSWDRSHHFCHQHCLAP